MDHRLLGWPPDGPRLRLDYRRFAYAGKFVTGDTGVAVTTEPAAAEPPLDEPTAEAPEPASQPPDRGFVDLSEPVVAAVAFNADRTDPGLWLRYVTVRRDRQGEGLAGRLAAFVCRRAATRAHDTVRIAVNNPAAYDALVRAGFTYTGRETGVAELVLSRPAAEPAPPDRTAYAAGLAVFRERSLPDEQRAVLRRATKRGPPERSV